MGYEREIKRKQMNILPIIGGSLYVFCSTALLVFCNEQVAAAILAFNALIGLQILCAWMAWRIMKD